MSVKTQREPGGTIEPGVIYCLEEFKNRAGWSKHAMRTARRRGLRVIYTAGRAYVRGDDALDYFDKVASDR